MARSATFSARPGAAALLAQAEHETGLHDFGNEQFRGPLEAFVRFLNAAGAPTRPMPRHARCPIPRCAGLYQARGARPLTGQDYFHKGGLHEFNDK